MWINHGFTLVNGEKTPDNYETQEILENPFFKKAKNLDKLSAFKFWNYEWNKNADENNHRLSIATQGCDKIVFISMPGTSHRNKIPLAAAESLATKCGKKARVLNGDHFFIPQHTKTMKSFTAEERLFSPRIFKEKKGIFQIIKDSCPLSKFFIVEDVITSGSSVLAFQRFLEKNGIDIYGVISMKGKYDPNVSKVLVKKMEKLFNILSLNLDATKLSNELTKREAMTILIQADKVSRHAGSIEQAIFKSLLSELYEVRVKSDYSLIPQISLLTDGLYIRRSNLNNSKKLEHQRD